MAETPEVRVRLTAEDAGVTAAVKQLTGELKTLNAAQQKAAKSGKELADGLQGLAGLGVGYLLASLAKNALEAADGLWKMSQKTGVSVETLSVMVRMAQLADVSAEDLQKGFNKLAKSTEGLQGGSREASVAFGKLGLSAKALKGLSLDQIMLKVAEAQAGFADGAGKSAVLMEIFGKSGANLIPLLNDLAGGGFGNAQKKLQDLGQVMSGDAAKAAQDFNDALKNLEQTGGTVLVQLASSVLPALTSALDGTSKAMVAAPTGMKAFAGSFLAIETTAIAAAMAVRMAYTAIAGMGPAGLAITALSLLASAFLAVEAAQEAATQAAVREIQARGQAVASSRALADEYAKLAQKLEGGSLKGKAAEDAQKRMKEIQDKLVQLSPDLQKSLQDEAKGYQEKAEAIDKSVKAGEAELRQKRAKLEADLEEAQARARLSNSMQNAQLAARFGGRYAEKAVKPVEASVVETDASVRSLKAQLDALGKVLDAQDAAKQQGDTRKPIPVVDDALVKARLEAQKQAAQQELQLWQSVERLKGDVEKTFYDQGLLGLEDYFRMRLDRIRQGREVELAALDKEREALQKTPVRTPAERVGLQAQLDALTTRRNLVWHDSQARQTQDEEAKRQAELAFANKRLEVENQIREATGATFEATLANLRRQGEELKRAGLDPALLAKLAQVQRQGALFGEMKKLGDQGFAAGDLFKAGLDQQVSAGRLFPFEAQRRIESGIQALLPTLQAYAQRLRDAAVTPEQIQAAADYELKVRQLGTAADRTAQEMAAFKGALESGLTNAYAEGLMNLSEALGDVALRTHDWGDAWLAVRDTAVGVLRAVAEAVQRAAADMLARYLMEQTLSGIASLFGGGSGPDPARAAAVGAAQAAPLNGAALALTTAGGVLDGSAAAIAASAAALEAAAASLMVANSMSMAGGFASGGLVLGPGSGTSDSIPARLSNFEFVVRSAVVRQPGMLQHLTALNRGLGTPVIRTAPTPRFAEGGLVDLREGGTGGGDSRMTVGLEPGLVLRALESSEGQRVLVRLLGQNARAASRALGRS